MGSHTCRLPGRGLDTRTPADILGVMKSLALSATVIGFSASAVPAEEPTTRQLLDRLNRQQVEIGQLKAEHRQWREQSQAVSRTQVEVRTDAARRSQTINLQSFTSGYRADQGFVLQSEAGDFLLHPWLLFQFRNQTTYREHAREGGGSDAQNGFEVRRLKLGLDGKLFSPRFAYHR